MVVVAVIPRFNPDRLEHDRARGPLPAVGRDMSLNQSSCRRTGAPGISTELSARQRDKTNTRAWRDRTLMSVIRTSSL
jgi:hypothetical protein